MSLTFATEEEFFAFVKSGTEVICLHSIFPYCSEGETGKIVAALPALNCVKIVWNKTPAAPFHDGTYHWSWFITPGNNEEIFSNHLAVIDYVNEWEDELELL